MEAGWVIHSGVGELREVGRDEGREGERRRRERWRDGGRREGTGRKEGKE